MNILEVKYNILSHQIYNHIKSVSNHKCNTYNFEIIKYIIINILNYLQEKNNKIDYIFDDYAMHLEFKWGLINIFYYNHLHISFNNYDFTFYLNINFIQNNNITLRFNEDERYIVDLKNYKEIITPFKTDFDFYYNDYLQNEFINGIN